MSTIADVTGYTVIEKLYVQLLYRCNFCCKHCFHGDRLQSKDQLGAADVRHIMRHFREQYTTRHVVLLGGEPFLHPDFVDIVRWCAGDGWFVETCTNGHRFVQRLLPSVVGSLSFLRVSIDGLRAAHDSMRQRGSFDAALRTLDVAGTLGFRTGVTTTVTADNVASIPALSELVWRHGACELKLHQLRLVGNAAKSLTTALAPAAELAELVVWMRSGRPPLKVTFDDDLDPAKDAAGPPVAGTRLDRVELDPSGGFTMSCKAVGLNAQAFYWDRQDQAVVYRPSPKDEIVCQIRDVNYV